MHLTRKIGDDALIIMQIRRILGVDEGEPPLPGQRNVIWPRAHAARPLENRVEFVQMTFGNRMTPCPLIVVVRYEVLEFGNEDRGSVMGTARVMTWRMEQPFVRDPEVPERLLVDNPANPIGLTTSHAKVLPTARFLPLATLFLDEKHLEDVSAKRRVGRNPHEAARIRTLDPKARFEKGSLVIDRIGAAKQLVKMHPGQMIVRQKVTTHRSLTSARLARCPLHDGGTIAPL
jgi:hypothetical protein